MGLFSSKTFNPITDIPDLTGKVALVTGGNAGLGYVTAEQLANHGATVYIAVRDPSKGKAAAEQIELDAVAAGLKDKVGKIKVLQLDLSSVSQTKEAAEKFLNLEQRLDILVNNAGFSPPNWQVTKDGIEIQMGINHLGHFILTTTLLPLLKQTASSPSSDVRVVTVSSLSHTSANGNVSFVDRSAWNNKYGDDAYGDSRGAAYARYGNSKLANILFARELQRRLDREGVPIISLTLHPGAVNTDGSTRFLGYWVPQFFANFAARYFFMTRLQGTANTLFAAASPEVKKHPEIYRGAYLVPTAQLGTASEKAGDEKMAQELWSASEKITAEILAESTH